MNSKMIRCALVGAVALLAASCLNKDDFKNEFNTHMIVKFEPDYYYMWGDFVDEFFNGGKDTVSFNPHFSVGPVFHFAQLDDSEAFQGGFALAVGKDTDASATRTPSRFAVYDENWGNQKSMAYAVFHDTTATLMPEHDIRISIPNEQSSCTPETMYVQNVQAVVQAAVHGVGLADGPFQAGDYLLLTVTGSLGGKVTGTKEVKLVDGTSCIHEWTEVKLTSLGQVDALDLHLTSSRADFPLYCCLDDMGYHYIEVYQ